MTMVGLYQQRDDYLWGHLDPQHIYDVVARLDEFVAAVTEVFEPLPRELRDPADIPHRVPNRAMRRHPRG